MGIWRIVYYTSLYLIVVKCNHGSKAPVSPYKDCFVIIYLHKIRTGIRL